MFLHARNGTVRLRDDDMHYVRFGGGKRPLIILPGVGDGLATVKGTAVPMALTYRALAREHTFYVFSRRNHLPAGSSTRDMARDLLQAMDALGIARADIVGVSMGGMIAQHFAADYPERTGRLVLVASCACSNPVLEESVSEWTAFARQGNHTALMDSSVRRIYSQAYYRKNRWLVPIVGRLTKPRSYDRFLIQAAACLAHDASDRLSSIRAKTLVLGGGQDRALGADASRELAASISGAKLIMYPQWGHGLYDEAKDFQQTVTDFLLDGDS